jgi:biotin carboxylase
MKRILLVFGTGGPPVDHMLPRVARHGELYAYIAEQPNHVQRQLLEEHCVEIVESRPDEVADDEQLRDAIVHVARRIGADAVVTFDEFFVVPTAAAARVLGLRGPGRNAHTSRDKWAMRRAFDRAGVESPAFTLVTDAESLLRACDQLGYPFLIKLTAGAGSISHSIIQSRAQALEAWQSAAAAAREYAASAGLQHVTGLAQPRFVAEEIIRGSTDTWYEVPGYGDYLSVEGIVCGAEYYPVAITSRLPTVYPFTEVGNQTPCVLDADLQYRIAEFARRTVRALGLEYCGTHTEIKLLADRGLCAVESAARLPGALNVPQIETVFGVDMVGLLTEALLDGGSSSLPPRMHVEGGRGAAGTLALLPVDVDGEPWRTTPRFDPHTDWSRMVSPGTHVDVDWTHAAEQGAPIAPYNPLGGVLNYFGILAIRADSPATLLNDQYSIRRGIRSALESANQPVVGR